MMDWKFSGFTACGKGKCYVMKFVSVTYTLCVCGLKCTENEFLIVALGIVQKTGSCYYRQLSGRRCGGGVEVAFVSRDSGKPV